MNAVDVKTKEDYILYQSKLIDDMHAEQLRLLEQIRILLNRLVKEDK